MQNKAVLNCLGTSRGRGGLVPNPVITKIDDAITYYAITQRICSSIVIRELSD